MKQWATNLAHFLKSRNQTIIYQADSRDFKSELYCGGISAYDYLKCRQGKSFEERRHNLIAVFSKVIVDHQIRPLQISTQKGCSIVKYPDITCRFVRG
jgi:hypothetical protein